MLTATPRRPLRTPVGLRSLAVSTYPEPRRHSGDIVVASRGDLEAALGSMARRHRMVFFAGLPGVGKSLFIRELARVAHAMGRTVHLLQWDVARPAFLSPAILARYPERDGIAPSDRAQRASDNGCGRRSCAGTASTGGSSRAC